MPCPVRESWRGGAGRPEDHNHMGGADEETPTPKFAAAEGGGCPMRAAEGGGCPMRRGRGASREASAVGQCPMRGESGPGAAREASAVGQSPMRGESPPSDDDASHGEGSDWIDPRNMMARYSQNPAPGQDVEMSPPSDDDASHGEGSDWIDPRNMMARYSQNPAPGQDVEISRVRETSSIPKTGEGSNWVYPSPQQFYNALLKRNKTAEADQMDAVVYVHNQVNEETWKEIIKYEDMHEDTCKFPTLQRFVGRYSDLTIKGRLADWFSYTGRPFDRHDWYVDRCGQKTVRYIVDYYDDPKAKDQSTETSIDVRPALDDMGNVWDRLRYPIWNRFFRREEEN